MASGATAIWALPYPVPPDANNVPADVQSLANSLDALISAAQKGLASARPAAAKFGRWYFATDSGVLSFDTGSAYLTFAILGTTAASVSASNPGDSKALGSATVAAPLDHVHGRETAASALAGTAAITTYTETLVTNSASGASAAINLNNGREFLVTLTANCTISFSNVPATANVRLTVCVALKQDATGSRTVTWPASVKWGTAGAPTLTTTPFKTDLFAFISDDNGTTWRGLVGGQGY